MIKSKLPSDSAGDEDAVTKLFIERFELEPTVFAPLIRAGLIALSKSFGVPVSSLKPDDRLGREVRSSPWRGFDPFQLVLEMETELGVSLLDDSAEAISKFRDVKVEQWLKRLTELKFRDSSGNEGDWRSLRH